MKKFLLTAALVVLAAAPAMAEDVSASVTESTTTTIEAPVAAPAVEAVVTAADAAKEACTSETNEKVKLPENAGDAEKAQWDAAFAECVKGKGIEVETTTETTTEVKTDEDAAAE